MNASTNLSSQEDVELEIKKHEEILNHYAYLNELKLSFVIFNAVNGKDIDGVRFCLLKSDYDDDGLREGCYFDVTSKKHKLSYVDCENYELDYDDKYQARVGVPEFNGATFAPQVSDNDGINTLRKLNDDVYNLLPNNYIENALNRLEDIAFKPTLEGIILAVCGKEKFNNWMIAQEKVNIAQSIPEKKSGSKKLKV